VRGWARRFFENWLTVLLRRVGSPGPQVIGVDVIEIRKGHSYRIVVSDLLRGRPIWFGGKDRSEASMGEFYAWLGKNQSARIRLAVRDASDEALPGRRFSADTV
jgi:transposase